MALSKIKANSVDTTTSLTTSSLTTGLIQSNGTTFDSVAILNNTGSGGKSWSMYSTMNSFSQGGGKWMVYNTDAGGGSYQLAADSTGRVTTPLQPMLAATVSAGTSNLSWVNGTVRTVPFNYKSQYVGSDFNTGTYTFTCPVAGTYFMASSLQVSGVSTTSGVGANLFLARNGAAFAGTYDCKPNYQYMKLDTTGIVSCAAGDTLRVDLYCGNQNFTGGSTEFAGDIRNNLFIYLLG